MPHYRLHRAIFLFSICISVMTPVCAEQLMHILTTSEAPTNYLSPQGEVIGIAVDVVEAIQQEIQSTRPIKLQPWPRAFAQLKRSPNSMAFTAGKTEHREAMGFHFVGPIFTRNYVLIARRERHRDIHLLADLQGSDLVVGAMRDDWRSRFIKAQGIEVEEVTLHSQNLRKLANRRIDFWVTSDVEAYSLINQFNYDHQAFRQVLRFRQGKSFLMFSKDTSEAILTRWQSAFDVLIERGFMHATAAKWSEILGLSLAFSPSKGFYIQGQVD